MIPNFSTFADLVAESFQKIAKGSSVFVTRIDGDDLYAAKKRAANKAEREKLLAILAEKQTDKLSALSEKELQKRINELEV